MPNKIEFDKRDTNYIVRQYANGHGMAYIAAEFGVTIPVIRRTLEEQGVTIRPRGRQPQS